MATPSPSWAQDPFAGPPYTCGGDSGWLLRSDYYWHCENLTDGTVISAPVFNEYLAAMVAAAYSVTSRTVCTDEFPFLFWYDDAEAAAKGTCRDHQ